MSYVGIYHFVENLKVSDPEAYKEFNFSEGELESVYEYDKFKKGGYSDDEIKKISLYLCSKNDYVMAFMSHIIETSNKDVSNFNGKLAEDILGLRIALNQEMNLLEQKYGDKLREVYNTVKLSNTEIENSLNKEWDEAMDEYQKGNIEDLPLADNYNPYKDSNYVESFEESAFLVSIAMRNALDKLPEYMADNIEDLSFNLDAAKEYNDNFLTHHLVYHYPSMCEKYNDIVNDSGYCAHLDWYKKFINDLENEESEYHDDEYDDIEDEEYDDVGDDAI